MENILNRLFEDSTTSNAKYDKDGENIRTLLKLTSLSVFNLLAMIGVIYITCVSKVNGAVLDYWAVFACVSTIGKSLAYYYLYTRLSNGAISKDIAVCLILIATVPEIIAFSSMGFLFFDMLDPFRVSLVIVLVDGLLVGASMLTLGFKRINLPYILPIYIFNMFFLTKYFSVHLSFWYEYAIIVFCFFSFFAAVLFLASYIYQTFSYSYDIRFRDAEMNRKLQDALNISEKANASKVQFLASASHDLRQPVHALSLFSAVLNMQPLEGLLKETSNNIHIATQALSKQLDALFDISKLDANAVSLNVKAQDVTPMFNELYQEFLWMSQEKGVAFEVQLPEKVIVRTDVFLFKRVLQNLLSNAFKYTDKGRIRLQVNEEKSSYLVQIEDTGIGVSEEDAQHIFDEFFQVNNRERDREKGLGLGLAIVKRLCEKLDITIELVSAKEKGSTFILKLLKADTQHYEAAISNEQDVLEVDVHQHQILVVDDDAIALKGTQTLLEALGHNVHVSENFKDTLALVEQYEFDVMLVDYRLRDGENGLRIIEAVSKIRPAIFTAIVSGDKDAVELKEAKDLGVTVLNKPVKARDLQKILTQSIGGRNEEGKKGS